MLQIARLTRGSLVLSGSQRLKGSSLRVFSSKTDVPDPFDSHFLNTITVENIKSSLRPWIIKCVERTVFRELSFEEQATVFNRLLMVHCFEVFLHTKYMSNRKCLFDCEVVLPALCCLIDRSLLNGAKSFVIGLSQLTQLTTLSKLTGDSEEAILTDLLRCRNDFALDDALEDDTSYLILDEEVVSEFIEPAKTQPYEVSLIGPPIPASAVYPLMMGRAKALQYVDKEDGSDAVYIFRLIDYNLAVVEISSKDTFTNIVNILKEPNLSAGGTIHIFINCEHAGFEEPNNSLESSSKLIKFLADMVKTPVVHVKAEEVDSVVYVMNMVSDFRANHKRDIIVNLMGGLHKPPHKNVASTKTLAGFLIEFLSGGKDPLVALYGKELISNKLLSRVEFDDRKESYLRKLLEQSNPKSFSSLSKKSSLNKRVKEPFTGASSGDLSQMVESLQTYVHLNGSSPNGASNLLEPISEAESYAVRNYPISVDNADLSADLNWESCVSLAYASMLKEGWNVHICRSAQGPASIICDPQALISKSVDAGEFKQQENEIAPSVMAGFQVGYSTTGSNLLAVWEVPKNTEPSTLHEIANDYFCRTKPDERLSPKVIFLVPNKLCVANSDSTTVEVSSQPSQILKNCEDSETLTGFNDQMYNCNVVVVNLSNPANLFHLICRHARSTIPRPLVVFVPNESQSTANVQDITGETCFLPYIGDTSVLDSNIKNVILCSGRIYDDLTVERAHRKMDRQIAISRIEQLCPFPYSNVIQDMERFPSARMWWAQEEEIADGCWNYVESRLLGLFGEERVVRFSGHYRPNESAQPRLTLQDRISAIFSVILDS